MNLEIRVSVNGVYMTETACGLTTKEEMVIENNYGSYQALGGRMSWRTYRKTLEQTEQPPTFEERRVNQAKFIAGIAGVPLNNEEGLLDKIITFYGVLRTGQNRTLCDQELFAEALRMLKRPDLLKKVIDKHPNIR